METNNTQSALHPHEPQITPQLDSEGRCLICAILVQIDQLKRELAEAKSEVAHLKEACTKEFNSVCELNGQLLTLSAAYQRQKDALKLWFYQGSSELVSAALSETPEVMLPLVEQFLATLQPPPPSHQNPGAPPQSQSPSTPSH